MILHLVIATALLAWGGTTAAAPTIDVHVDYYWVSGDNPAQLRQALNDAGPFDPPTGRRFDARTNWYVDWRFWWRQSAVGCLIDRTEVRASIQYILPKVSDDARLSRAERDRWDSYRAKLKAHEDGHAENGRGAAYQLEAALRALPPQPCAQVQTAANDAARRVIEEFKRRDQEFDQRTDRGRTQGAHYP